SGRAVGSDLLLRFAARHGRPACGRRQGAGVAGAGRHGDGGGAVRARPAGGVGGRPGGTDLLHRLDGGVRAELAVAGRGRAGRAGGPRPAVAGAGAGRVLPRPAGAGDSFQPRAGSAPLTHLPPRVRTTASGAGASWTSAWLTEPSTIPAIAPCPREPTTSRSAPAAASLRTSTGWPWTVSSTIRTPG